MIYNNIMPIGINKVFTNKKFFYILIKKGLSNLAEFLSRT